MRLARSLQSLAKARQAMWMGDKMQLIGRSQRTMEAFARQNQPGLATEDEVKLIVDSPTTTNYCQHPKGTTGPWLFASVLLLVAAVGAGVWWFSLGHHAPAAPTKPPIASTPGSKEYLEITVEPES